MLTSKGAAHVLSANVQRTVQTLQNYICYLILQKSTLNPTHCLKYLVLVLPGKKHLSLYSHFLVPLVQEPHLYLFLYVGSGTDGSLIEDSTVILL